MELLIVIIFQIAILVFSVIVHELAHGYVADYLGDPTPRDAGRLTWNPITHLDLFGSFLIPLMLFIIQSPFMFGWAKPVPINPYNTKKNSALIAAAGPASNFFIAIAFGVLFRFIAPLISEFSAIGVFAIAVVQINVLLGIFNLVPIPPLDGSRILFAFLPDKMLSFLWTLEKGYGLFLVFLFIYFGFRLIWPIVAEISRLILGM
jgi:Zn-dependent protease